MQQDDYQRLRLKIIATTLAFSFVPLLALGVTIYLKTESVYVGKVYGNLRTLVENKKTTIDLFLNERISQLTTLAFTETFVQLSDEKYLEKVFSILQIHSKSFIDLQVIDQEGNTVSYCGPYRLKDVNYSQEPWFNMAMARGLYVSDVFLGFRKYPHFIIAVTRREGDQSWILRAAIDSDIFDTLVRSVHLGKSGDAFLLTSENVLQTKPRFDDTILEKIEFPRFSKFSGTRVEEFAVKGKTSLYAMAWLDNKDWLLVIKDDPREELLPLYQARWLLVFILFGGTLIIIGGAVFIANSMVRQLVRSEREKASLDASLTQSSKMAALGKLAAGVAHEVNNPLAIIMEKAGWMRDLLSEEDIKASPNFQEYADAVQKIEFHVRRAKDVTHRLLGFARRMDPLRDDINVNILLDQTKSFLENEASFRNIEILADYDRGLPSITSDASQLQQVFLNIIDNAIDAIDKDGVITVTTRHDKDAGAVVIAITDTGKGMPKEVADKIFDPFFTTKKVGEGTGLGLTISYSIIEKLGGKIVLQSAEGKGTTFTITLPAH
ncbi:MAG: ATP-binding protein [Desulfovibrionaceae bacterium]|nr:ATP-binding protein [Desulfovibrionaceae bacterium]